MPVAQRATKRAAPQPAQAVPEKIAKVEKEEPVKVSPPAKPTKAKATPKAKPVAKKIGKKPQF